MTVTDAVVVSIDAAIRARPELLAQVEDASRYFEKEYLVGPALDRQVEPTSLEWRLSPVGSMIEVTSGEHDSHGERYFTEPIPLDDMADRVDRESCIRRLLRSMLNVRWRNIHAHMDRLIREQEEVETHGRTLTD